MLCATRARRRRTNNSRWSPVSSARLASCRVCARSARSSCGMASETSCVGIATLLEHAGQILHWGEAPEVMHLEPHQRARFAFEQLGPTFVKLGQMLSTREDLLPPAWTTELARLHSDVTPL